MPLTGPSLYVHVPFCRSKCAYCSFTSYPAPDQELQLAVARATAEQAVDWAERSGGLDAPTVYVGGGTPSVLAQPALEELLVGIERSLSAAPEEFTVEANPESVSPAFLETCASHGVGRVSLGIQTFSPLLRKAVGRRCQDAEIGRALELVRRLWRGKLSLDLISGLPGQRPLEVSADVDRAVALAPNHVSLYSLTLEHEHSTLTLAAEADDLWLEGRARLEERGYPNYEVCNFAPAGSECLHNLRYWRIEPYVGVGPAAVSTIPDGRGGVLRVAQPESLEDFLALPRGFSADSGESVSPQDFLFETLIMGLRLRAGIDTEAFIRRFGASLPELLPSSWSRWSAQGGLQVDPGRYALTDDSRLFLNSLLVEAREEIDRLPEDAVVLAWP